MSLFHKWLAALRSGKYPQVRHYLRTPEGYCANGVLCDVSGMGEWVQKHDPFIYQTETEQNVQAIPYEVHLLLQEEGAEYDYIPPKYLTPEQWARFPSYYRRNIPLYTLNDVGFSFAEIADLLEKINPGLVNQEQVSVPG